MPRDAEAWLAARGIARESIRLTPTADEVAAADRAATEETPGPTTPGAPGPAAPDATPVGGAEVSSRHAQLLAEQSADEAAQRADAEAAATRVGRPTLEDDVAAALAFVRRSTANAPQAVGRLRAKLAERDTPAPAIDLALERAHAEGLVDDDAIARSFVEERQRRGHAPTRIRRDLAARGFDREVVDRALADAEGQDLEAAAYAVAREKADRLTGVAPETAMRRVVGHVARRGYPEGLARKVAREAIYTARDAQRTAGH
ncbi:regulatory protein RecX [Nitriliruptoraceae bacterium ZYF776]|nr:regulatory protein RecX [Profundirhabdus halotolerans]